MVFAAGDILTADDVNGLPRLIARGKRTTNSTTTTTEQGVLRLDDIPLISGRCYFIIAPNLALDGTVGADVIRASLRVTTDGSTPTTSSTILTGGWARQDNTSFAVFASPAATYVPGSDQNFSILLTVARSTGTGTVGMLGSSTGPIEILVFDCGEDPGDTGTDI